MPRAIISRLWRRVAYEPLYDTDPRTGANVEVLCADRVLAQSFGGRDAGWFRWRHRRACLPDGLPTGSFGSTYLVYRDFATR